MSENESNHSGLIKVSVIVVCIVTCVILFTCIVLFGSIYRSEIPIVKNYFPTSTPTTTPTPTLTPIPRILVHSPSKNSPVLKDEFITNENNWSTYYSLGRAEVKNGKLFFETFKNGNIGIMWCFCKAPAEQPFADTFYLQADLSTEKPTRRYYGLMFSLTDNTDFYEFSINPGQKRYFLQKNLDDGWINLFSGQSKIIKDYPEPNTLSVYFDHGSIELFINGEKVTTYIDKTPINKGKFGFIADNANFKLIVDNLFAYNEK